MSPERAQGKPVDRKTDIWAYGCVLYEGLTGRRAFPGETVPETVASILKDEPSWALLPAETPPIVQSVLRRCLQKDPSRRLHDIADLAKCAVAALEDFRGGPYWIGIDPGMRRLCNAGGS